MGQLSLQWMLSICLIHKVGQLGMGGSPPGSVRQAPADFQQSCSKSEAILSLGNKGFWLLARFVQDDGQQFQEE